MTIAPPTLEHSIEELCKRSHFIAKEHGWVTEEGDTRTFATVTNLNHSELSEAWEEWRNNRKLDETYYEGGAKPAGIPVELADFVIRICQWAGSNGHGKELDELCGLSGAAPYMRPFDEFLADAHYAISMSRFTQSSGVVVHWLSNAVRITFGFCASHSINLWAAIDEKEAYNRTRPMRHGGKKV
jgi:hypothetical protein